MIKKKEKKKNEVNRNLSACVLEKFNRYESIRQNLTRKEKVDFTPVIVVYEPNFDESVPVLCNFTDKIHLAYKSYVGRFNKRKERICNQTVKQYHYCQKCFAKNDEAMKEHLSICAAKEDITYSFDNGQILDYKDNFKYQGDLPFSVYFDFETTKGSAVIFDAKMYAVSYCQIYSFHPPLDLDKIVIYRSFQQTPQQIYDLSHFKQEHKFFFNAVGFRQLKDAASAVLAREKPTSLAELFL